MKTVELIFVDPTNKNKFYRMVEQSDGTFKAFYGRIGSRENTEIYSMSKWNTKYKEKIKKGYTDVTHLKIESTIGNINVDVSIQSFYNTIERYTKNNVSKNYNVAVNAVTSVMISEAQSIIDSLSKETDLTAFNRLLVNLFTVIPRKMSHVSNHLAKPDWQESDFQKLVAFEQDTLDSLQSNVITTTTVDINLEDLLGAKIEKETNPDIIKQLTEYFDTTKAGNVRIHDIYKIVHNTQIQNYSNWINSRTNKQEELFFHGTRNANVFSIIKQGLLIRPSNAAVYSGSVYGDGTYFSRHAAKSLNYTGHDSDKILFINTVNIGNPYIYNGWYRDGKGLSRSQMNYNYLNSQGYDSLWVKAGDGLLRDEIICYQEPQYKHSYILWVR